MDTASTSPLVSGDEDRDHFWESLDRIEEARRALVSIRTVPPAAASVSGIIAGEEADDLGQSLGSQVGEGG